MTGDRSSSSATVLAREAQEKRRGIGIAGAPPPIITRVSPVDAVLGARSLSTRDAGDSGTLRDMANNVKTVGLLGLLGGMFVAVGWLFGGQ